MNQDDGGDDDPEAVGCRDWFDQQLPKLERRARTVLRAHPVPDWSPVTLVGFAYVALWPKWESRCRSMPSDELRGYVYGTMRRIAMTENRRAHWISRRFPLVEASDVESADRADSADQTAETADRREMSRRLRSALDEFLPDERLMLALRLDGFSQREIADRLGCKPHQVSRKLRQLIRRLIALLVGEDDGGIR